MSDPLHTVVCDLLGSRYPVIQTAMGWVATPELVAATCNAGAFGFLACAVMPASEVGPAIDRVRQLTDAPFGVNFHMFQPGAEQIVATLIQKRVKAVSFGRGPDRAMILRFKDAGIRCIPTVGALKHAHKMAALGVDALVVQGGEGGGHTGSVPSTILLPQVLDAVKLPVVAAGGFADGRGLVAALAFGAQGIAMGTRFLMTRDCPVPESTKRRYVLATTDDILVTKRVDGIPQRMIRNETLAGLESANGLSRLLRAVRGASDMKRHTGATWRQMFELLLAQRRGSELSFSQSLYAGIAPALFERAMVGGLPETGLLATGLVAGRLDTLPSCSELLTEIMQDARTRIDALNGSTK